MRLSLNSYAKLNLFLKVLRRRKDGYHSIQTLFERISLCDKIILKSRPDAKITLTCDSREVPADSSNLAFRAAKLLQDTCKVKKGVEIALKKRIPVGAGLGGGSANAACVLEGLNRLWKLNLSKAKLASLAGRIGADVPFFIHQAAFACGSGRGDLIRPVLVKEKLKIWQVLVVPRLHVSTPAIYQGWDNLTLRLTRPLSGVKILSRRSLSLGPDALVGAGRDSAPPGASEFSPVRILLSALRKQDWNRAGKVLFNSLEEVSLAFYPEIVRVKSALKKINSAAVMMSGSGPAVFALVGSRKEAHSACNRLKKKYPHWQAFAVHAV